MADQTNLGKVYTHFQAKTAKKTHTLWGGTCLYGLYQEVPPPPGGLLVAVPSPDRGKTGEGSGYT